MSTGTAFSSGIQNSLIEKAARIHKVVLPCGGHSSLYDCFTVEGNVMYLWYNTRGDNNTTHTVFEYLS